MSSPGVDRASGCRDHASPTDVPHRDTLRLMARKNTGSVFEKVWSDGTTISYGAYVRAYGRREKVTFGTNKQGWNARRAEIEVERIVQQIERGTWVPPRLEPREDRLESAMADLGPHGRRELPGVRQTMVARQAARA